MTLMANLFAEGVETFTRLMNHDGRVREVGGCPAGAAPRRPLVGPVPGDHQLHAGGDTRFHLILHGGTYNQFAAPVTTLADGDDIDSFTAQTDDNTIPRVQLPFQHPRLYGLILAKDRGIPRTG